MRRDLPPEAVAELALIQKESARASAERSALSGSPETSCAVARRDLRFLQSELAAFRVGIGPLRTRLSARDHGEEPSAR